MGVAYSMHYIFSSIRRYYTSYATVSKIMFAKIIIALDNNLKQIYLLLVQNRDIWNTATYYQI